MSKTIKYESEYYKWEIDSFYEKKTGIYPVNLSSVVNENGIFVNNTAALNLYKSKSNHFYSKILEKGPFWDCLIAGTSIIVSERLKKYIVNNSGEDVDFLPINLKGKDDKIIESKYYLIILKYNIKAIDDDYHLVPSLLKECKHKIVIARNTYRTSSIDYYSEQLIDSNLAEAMIEEGFTGLGFSNPFSSKKPGIKKGQERVFAEEQSIKDYLSVNPLLLLGELINKNYSFQEYINIVFKECTKKAPSKIWNKLAMPEIYQNESEKHLNWIKDVFKNNPPKNIKAIWIGIFEKGCGAQSIIPTAYISGSNKYSEDEKYDFDWACDPIWFPENRYFHSEYLKRCMKYINKSDDQILFDQFSYFFVLSYIAILFKNSFEKLDLQNISFFGSKYKPIAVGFDEGDAFFIGKINDKGFKI